MKAGESGREGQARVKVTRLGRERARAGLAPSPRPPSLRPGRLLSLCLLLSLGNGDSPRGDRLASRGGSGVFPQQKGAEGPRKREARC